MDPRTPTWELSTSSDSTLMKSSFFRMQELYEVLGVTACFLVGLFLWSRLVEACWSYLWTPLRIRRALKMQGLTGPPPKFMLGNMDDVVQMKNTAFREPMAIGDHDLVPRICPYYWEWSKIYGRMFVFWWGTEARITVTEPELIKQILYTKSGHFGKSPLQQKGGSVLLGNGLIMANGERWAHRRQIVSRAFRIDKLKGMVPSMVESAHQLIKRWDGLLLLKGEQEVDVYQDLAVVTADIIARTAFGSSYSDGIKLFHSLTSIQRLFIQSNKYLWLPGSRFLPTTVNKTISKLKKEMQASLQELIKDRRDSAKVTSSFGNDLLGLMLSASEDPASECSNFKPEELIEECQTFFFVGHETTLMLVTWTLMLLSLHPDWQSRAREEVVQVCNGKAPDADMLCRLKTVAMVLNEALRLYPPVPNLVRAALRDTEVGNLFIPKGSTFWIPILAIHHDTRLWGADAHEFRPDRFSEGVSRSMENFLPFSFGPRICVGLNFAVMEAKLLVAMILQHYNLKLSPSYEHSPVSSITLKPKQGMQLIISPVGERL